MSDNLDGTSPARGVSAIVPKDEGGFPNPGLPPHVHRQADTNPRAEKRAERMVAGMFLLSVVGTVVFIAAYFLVTPHGTNILAESGSWTALWWSNLITGLGLAIAVFFIGAAAVHWAKTLMPDEEWVEARHDIRGSDETREAAAGIITDGLDESGIARRPLIVTTMVAALAALPVAVLAPLSTLGPLPGNKLHHTFWGYGRADGEPIRLTRDHDGTPIRAADVAMNSIFHVMPDGLTLETPHHLEERAKAAAVLVRIDPRLGQNQESLDNGYEGILAFSKICTHVGCPVALYEQQTHHILCPCHQSTFDVTDGAKVIFGPAHRPLPQLPIEVDDEGYLVATGDFPDHWSFMFGEVALYSFIILLISGTFLTMFFDPSMEEVVYNGPYEPFQGLHMSRAYESTLEITFEVTGGMLFRQMHHWAALVFMVAIFVHMFRVFFTGAFRKPRELNWLVGFGLLVLGMAAGFSGYSLPDDVLSGNGLRIADGVAKSIPIIGTYVSFLLFGGEFPGTDIIPRLFAIHIMIVPAAILALIGIHLVMLVVHKHTQYPGPGRTDRNVVGFPVPPVYAAKAGGFFFIVFGVITFIAATTSINAIHVYGPYDPSPVSAGAQPDWYILFLEGGLRLMPGFAEYTLFGYTLSLNILIPGVVVPGIMFGFMALYPFIESWITGDDREHHVLDLPYNVPVRTGLGVAWITAYLVLAVSGSNDILAHSLQMSVNDTIYFFRIGFFVLPIILFWVTKRVCLSIQRKKREEALHGVESSRIVRTEDGEMIEIHEPMSEYDRWVIVQPDDYRPLKAGNGVSKLRAMATSFFFKDRIDPVTPADLREALEHAGHEKHKIDELTGGDYRTPAEKAHH